MRRWAMASVALCGLWLFSPAALAHSIALWVEAQDGKIYVEAVYSDGDPVAGAAIELHDKSGKLLLRTKLDKQGHARVTPPALIDTTVSLVSHHGAPKAVVVTRRELEAGRE